MTCFTEPVHLALRSFNQVSCHSKPVQRRLKEAPPSVPVGLWANGSHLEWTNGPVTVHPGEVCPNAPGVPRASTCRSVFGSLLGWRNAASNQHLNPVWHANLFSTRNRGCSTSRDVKLPYSSVLCGPAATFSPDLG